MRPFDDKMCLAYRKCTKSIGRNSHAPTASSQVLRGETHGKSTSSNDMDSSTSSPYNDNLLDGEYLLHVALPIHCG